MNNKITIRECTENDCALLIEFIKQLAKYENMLDQVTVTEEILKDSLFNKNIAKAIIAEYDGTPCGYALYFYNFSTWHGKPGIYLEDLFVKPEYRGYGIGKALFTYVAKKAYDNNYARFEWVCLDWNAPSIKFYKSMGAKAMDEWTTYRLDGDNLKNTGNIYPNL